MHICDQHIKVYYNIEKRKLVKIEIEIYKGGTEIYREGGWGEQKWTSAVGVTTITIINHVHCTVYMNYIIDDNVPLNKLLIIDLKAG